MRHEPIDWCEMIEPHNRLRQRRCVTARMWRCYMDEKLRRNSDSAAAVSQLIAVIALDSADAIYQTAASDPPFAAWMRPRRRSTLSPPRTQRPRRPELHARVTGRLRHTMHNPLD